MFWEIVARTIVVHTLTYFVVGLIAYRLLNYTAMLAAPERASFMRPTSDPLVRAGVLFQPIRGLLFGTVFYLLRGELFDQGNGWLVMWVMLVFVGILSTFAPAPSSIEGLIYTKSSFPRSAAPLEILIQSFLLSVLTFYWVGHPDNAWLNWGLGAAFVIVLVLIGLGSIASRRRAGATPA